VILPLGRLAIDVMEPSKMAVFPLVHPTLDVADGGGAKTDDESWPYNICVVGRGLQLLSSVVAMSF
jgi:hypothetical protein